MAGGKAWHLLRRFTYTSVALAFAILILVAALFSNVDVFELPNVVVPGIEPSEMGEVVTAFLFIIPALFVDSIVARQRAHEAHIVAEQLRVLQVTIRTVQDIVNNNLNQLQLLRLEAEGHVQADTLKLFDEAIQDTAERVTALGNMEAFAEKPMEAGSSLDPFTKGST